MDKPTRRIRRRTTDAPNPYSEAAARPPRAGSRSRANQDVPVYGPEYADDPQAEDYGAIDFVDADAGQSWDDAMDLEPELEPEFEQEPLLPPDPGKAHQFIEPKLFHSSPVHRYDEEEQPNPTQPRKWPLYLAVMVTTLLVFVAINVERGRQETTHWAGSEATGINDSLVPQEIMRPAVGLPTRIPQAYLDEAAAAFAETEEIATPTPFVTEPPVVHTPAPTQMPLLRKGMQGDFIKSVQARLAELNYLEPEQVDGKYEDATVKAVRAFQENNYLLPPDGMVGTQTYVVLFNPEAVLMPTPTPRLDEPYVWATNNGTYYHTRPECRNMKGATEWPLSQAKEMRKRPCDRCNPPR
ncbi:MAG: peptidoglycan-binding protein [Clostridia bacterium]|nr:peptidoglycan-binding protein [Clostridia bacterium]